MPCRDAYAAMSQHHTFASYSPDEAGVHAELLAKPITEAAAVQDVDRSAEAHHRVSFVIYNEG